ncbi:odorant receptor 4-like isoform X1 [Apis mellifera]|uniref:Odorant receptor n=1 Tax=Apis mellifera TaxID=7460 RepID=A0A7M7SRY6_APIME|nr:odorant receptor 4-like isoform X1 [Apis mellifera]|eukprot:XP_026301537.1 odorant receptor 4-like isoform X1 [Apis mellifera]
MLKMDINLTLNSLSYTSCTCICIMKYFNCLFHIKDIKNFLDEIKNDWNSLRNIEELRIIHEYSKTIKKITICFVIIIVPLQLVFFLNVFGNNILDILIPLNHTRPRTVPIEIYYFIDQQKFFFFFGMHLNIITSFGGLVYIAIETIYMGMIQHLCGLLKITSFRISHTFVANIPKISSTERSIIIRKKVMSIVYLHVKIKNYINWIQEKIIITYDLLILLGLIAFSIFIFELAKSITSRTNTNEIFSSLIFVICITIYGFIPNHFAQEIINHSSNIFIDTYNTEWYKLPIIEQKLLLFIMQNNLKNLNFVLLGTMIASYNVYVMILRTAFSYFMVIYSMD